MAPWQHTCLESWGEAVNPEDDLKDVKVTLNQKQLGFLKHLRTIYENLKDDNDAAQFCIWYVREQWLKSLGVKK